ncbi:hypothetical protein IM660_09240 [Ruania alkalisoli]|uniref:Thioredoxin domain-containing protein n=1 Tax=Ruania alkalisoli TaxID=2779775 RepID=A0A7M1SXT2_9MICO|nr:thioredoxin domain-containing protein [Ruania alkalisoli]QOR72380.1 hypothetical protein IM660_09240 [Ruania alkalisoli]
MMTREITKDKVEEVPSSEGAVLSEFWADWCGPCRMFGWVFDEAPHEYPDMVSAMLAEQNRTAGGDPR